MNDLKNKFSETEWMCITISPMCAFYLIALADMRKGTDKELEVFFSTAEKYRKQYPENAFVQSALSSFNTSEDFNKTTNLVFSIPDEIKKHNKEILELIQQNSKINHFLDDPAIYILSGGLAAMNGCLIIIGCTDYILKSKNISERLEFNRMLMGIAADTASAVKEGAIFGFGKSITKEEENQLELLRKILE